MAKKANKSAFIPALISADDLISAVYEGLPKVLSKEGIIPSSRVETFDEATHDMMDNLRQLLVGFFENETEGEKNGFEYDEEDNTTYFKTGIRMKKNRSKSKKSEESEE